MDGLIRQERYRAKRRADPVRYAAFLVSNRQQAARVNARSHESPELWKRLAIARAKYRAQRHNVAFDLSAEAVYVPAQCPVFGVAFVYGVKGHPNSPSLDRIIPTLGYVKGNVAVISRRANIIKNNASAAELERVAAWLRGVS